MNDQSTEKTAVESPGNGSGFRIVRLQAQNVKKLKAIDITPKPGAPLVIVAGNNGEGKTSVLDAIMWALGGADAVPKDPIRHGQTKAIATVGFAVYGKNQARERSNEIVVVGEERLFAVSTTPAALGRFVKAWAEGQAKTS